MTYTNSPERQRLGILTKKRGGCAVPAVILNMFPMSHPHSTKYKPHFYKKTVVRTHGCFNVHSAASLICDNTCLSKTVITVGFCP